MQKLVAKLQVAQQRGSREKSIPSTAVIAGVVEKDFAMYYEGIIPLLKQLLAIANWGVATCHRGRLVQRRSQVTAGVVAPGRQVSVSSLPATGVASCNVGRR